MKNIIKRKISIKDKFVLYFLFIFSISSGLIAYLVIKYSGEAILNRTFEQLINFKIQKKRQIETFFGDRYKELDFLLNQKIINKIPENDIRLWFNDYLSNKPYFKEYILEKISDINNPNLNEFIKKSSEILKLHDYTLVNGFPELFFSKKIKIKGIVYFFLIKMTSEQIDKIMLEKNPYDGVGNSGETYLIGEDYFLRSTSRFIPNSILKVKCETENSKLIFIKDTSSLITEDYRGVRVLSTSTLLNIEGIKWGLLSEIDYEEAMIPIEKIQLNILLLSIITSTIIFIVTYFLANKVTKPLLQMTKNVKDLQLGNFSNEKIEYFTNDEIRDLADAFNILKTNLQIKNEELKKERIERYTAEMDAQEKEKERLSKELHDGIGQMFVALKLKLENIDLNQEDSQKKIIEIKKNIDETINEIRRISNDLMPAVLSTFGLNYAINNLLNELKLFSKINFNFETNINQIYDKKTNIYLFRIVQESLNNIIKHSKAHNVEIKLLQNKNYTLLISDDGIGFDFEQTFSKKGNGLYNMYERINSLGGKINIETSNNNGTLIIINIPINYGKN